MSEFKPSWSRSFLEKMVSRIISKISLQNSRCLNVGCGVEGRYTDLLARFDIDGVDADPNNPTIPWRYYRCDARKLPFADLTIGLAIDRIIPFPPSNYILVGKKPLVEQI